MKKDKHEVGGPFVAINKNLLNYPLARDKRSSEFQWQRGNKSNRWYGQVKDDDRIKYRFDADTDSALLRPPTAFEINVLFLILGTAQHRKKDRVIFDSRSQMLKLLRYGADVDNLDRLDEALVYWAEVTITFGKWHFSKPRNKLWSLGPPKSSHFLPPPLKYCSQGKHKVTVTLAPAWADMVKLGFYEKVPLPLPRDAAGQNFVLCMLASEQSEFGQTIGKPRRQRRLCRKLGINHSRRNQVFSNAVTSAGKWFAANHGELEIVQRYGKVLPISLKRPRRVIERRRRADKGVAKEAVDTVEMPQEEEAEVA
jgi:hypothetical protein